MKRILLLTLEYPPDHGGVARYYSGIVSAMPPGSVVVYRPTLARWCWPRWLPIVWNVWRKIRQEKITDVWVGQVLPLGTVVYLLRRLQIIDYRFKIIVFTHGMDVMVPQQSRWKTFLVKKIFGAASKIVANSNFTKAVILSYGVSEDKIIIVYPCPTVTKSENHERIKEQLIERYDLKAVPLLLTVARLVKRKGVDLVLEALPGVLDFVTGLHYIVIGDGPEMNALKSKSRDLKIDHRTHFVGAVSDEELSAWYDLCHVFILTPRQINDDVEGFGLVYLEAGTFGKPVIGTRTGGVLEAIVDGETGWLVPEENIERIKSKIMQLFSNDVLEVHFGVNGKERVRKEFQWAVQVRKIV